MEKYKNKPVQKITEFEKFFENDVDKEKRIIKRKIGIL